MNNFPNTQLLLTLLNLERQLLNQSKSISEEVRHSDRTHHKCREMGRAHGFAGAAHMVDNQINKLMKQMERKERRRQ